MAGWGVTGRDTATDFRLYQDTHLGWAGCHRQRYSYTVQTLPGYTPWLGGVSQAEIQLHSSDCTRIHTLAGWGATGRDTATHLRLYQDTQKGEKNVSSGKDERNV